MVWDVEDDDDDLSPECSFRCFCVVRLIKIYFHFVTVFHYFFIIIINTGGRGDRFDSIRFVSVTIFNLY